MANLILNSEVQLAVRDFDGLAQAFQEFAQANYSDIWTDFNDGSFANAISEIVAYLGDNLHFFIDRQTQDNYLSTTRDRQAAIDLSSLIAYRPFNATPSSGTVTLTLDPGTFNYASPILSGFKVSNGQDILLESVGSTTASLGSTSVDIEVIEGETIRETTSNLGALAIGSGAPFQSYILARRNVILSRTIDGINDNSDLVVTVNGDTFTATSTLSTALSTDKVFTVQTNDDNDTIITFGNGILGVIPQDGEVIEATYRVLADEDVRLGQSNGNVNANGVTTLVTDRTGVTEVNNASAMTGGDVKETLDEIKINAPASLSALNRAVSLRDFATLARDVNGVSKAVAIPGSDDLDVIVHVAPNGGGFPSEVLKSAVVSNFDDKKMPKTVVFARDPVYQDVQLSMRVFVEDTFKQSEVLTNIRNALDDLFDFNNLDFGRPVLLKSTSSSNDLFDLYETVESVDGIKRVQVDKFTILPVMYDLTLDNVGSLRMSTRKPAVRDNSGRFEYKVIAHDADEFIAEKAISGQSSTLNDTTISDLNLDFTLTSGTSTDNGAGFLQDSSQSFRANEFQDQSLIDSNGTVYLITGNTEDTISVSSGSPSAGNYIVVERFVGYRLQPNTNRADTFRVISNDANSFTVSGGLGTVAFTGNSYRVYEVLTNEFTTQSLTDREDPVSSTITAVTFSGGNLVSLTDSSLAGTYADDSFNGYQMTITDGDASNLLATVSDYNGATGTFTLGSPGVIETQPLVGDSYVCAPKFIVGVDSEVDNSSFVPTDTQFELPELAGAGTNYYVGWKIKFLSGTHNNKIRVINAYDESNGRFTIDSLGSPPDSSDSVELSKDYEDNQRSIVFSTVKDSDLQGNDTFFFNTSELVGDLIPENIQILQINTDVTEGDVILRGVGGSI